MDTSKFLYKDTSVLTLTFSQMTQNEFSVCKAAEGGDAVAMARACLKIHFRIIITARQEDCNVRKILV